jgi:hypothetical protein
MALATVTVNNASPGLDHKSSEGALVAKALSIAAQQIQSQGGLVTSGTMTGDGGVVLGTWALTNQASNP